MKQGCFRALLSAGMLMVDLLGAILSLSPVCIMHRIGRLAWNIEKGCS